MGDNFCCCSLKTGTLIYGYILLVLSAFQLIENIYVIANSAYVSSPGGIIGTLLYIVSIVLLIYGATKEKKIFVLIFLVWNAISLVTITIFVIFYGIIAPIVFVGLPIIAIFVYLWYNVLCYFKHLSAKERHGDRDVEGRMFDEPPAYEDK